MEKQKLRKKRIKLKNMKIRLKDQNNEIKGKIMKIYEDEIILL